MPEPRLAARRGRKPRLGRRAIGDDNIRCLAGGACPSVSISGCFEVELAWETLSLSAVVALSAKGASVGIVIGVFEDAAAFAASAAAATLEPSEEPLVDAIDDELSELFDVGEFTTTKHKSTFDFVGDTNQTTGKIT